MDNYFLIIFASILFSAFFAGTEIAFITANKLLIELKHKQGSIYAGILSPFVTNPSKFISTTLIGNNIGLVVYSIYMEKMLDPIFIWLIGDIGQHPFLILFLQTIVSTIIVLFFAEFIPKVLFRINPDNILKVLAIPFKLFYYLFWPFVHFINWLAKLILSKLMRVQFAETSPAFTRVDLDQYISQVEDHDLSDDAEVDTEIFKNALDFSNIRVRECMTPRTELTSISVDAGIKELYNKFIETGLSKILVTERDTEMVIGYVHQKEIFKHPKTIKSILIPIEIATETMGVMELLNKFSKSRKSIALVVDELGETAGVVTIEDIMEEIFGEIEDEHDVEILVEEKLANDEFRFSARLEIYYLNNEYELNIPEGEYHTLGGFIIAMHESIPQPGEKVVIDQFEFVIEAVNNTHIDLVKMKILKKESE